MREAGYVGAGTCEFLVGCDGTISFLEVNTRLQVEHPVSEEVTGLDLVREQFRIAAGEEIGYDDPAVRGHSIEFRINAEDAGRNFMPAPGSLVKWLPPTGPGIRVDEGYHAPMAIAGEIVCEGMPTVLPFHRAVVDDPAFATDFSVHTLWIETEFSQEVPPYTGALGEPDESHRGGRG